MLLLLFALAVGVSLGMLFASGRSEQVSGGEAFKMVMFSSFTLWVGLVLFATIGKMIVSAFRVGAQQPPNV
ncbi:MAG: hypothetical protein KC561_06015 [Myxococcales bacterium]|nr:hypothetical protein [Myxococcales bacterium]